MIDLDLVELEHELQKIRDQEEEDEGVVTTAEYRAHTALVSAVV